MRTRYLEYQVGSPYEGIADELGASILDGRLGSGERLPSENELSRRYETSRPTVRRAIALLKAEGLVTAERGRGVFVRSKPRVRLLPSGEPENIAGGAYGPIEDPDGPMRRRLRRSIDDLECRMPTPAEVEELQLGSGVPVVRVLRTVYDAEKAPVEVQETIAAADKHQFRYEVAMP
jgi:DNA-binding GntR family transcriptional regulator